MTWALRLVKRCAAGRPTAAILSPALARAGRPRMGDITSIPTSLSFSELLEARGVLVADGATGTNYQDLGLEPGVAPGG